VYGSTEGRRERTRIGMDEQFTRSRAVQHDLDAAGVPVSNETHKGVSDAMQSLREADDRDFGLCAERFRHFGMVRVQDDLH
jgi:hypothetical protein